MKQPYLESISVSVANIDLSLDFLRKAFPKMQLRGINQRDAFDRKVHWLHLGSEDFFIALIEDPIEGTREESDNPGLCQLAFVVDDCNEIIQNLKAHGYKMHHESPKNATRRRIFYYDQNGLEIQFIQYLQDNIKGY